MKCVVMHKAYCVTSKMELHKLHHRLGRGEGRGKGRENRLCRVGIKRRRRERREGREVEEAKKK